ncbi:putative patch repair protein [Rhodopseudomonas palustris HaA2]|uniref:Very short patch repair endonuclease n=1 Tax=Rhodopseudomonas palustris (strain HaA2) TaxID=316058 RepID=Q2J2X8_RHOP2|nr:very short patch repair endonuclease [Rhodopseudomonas palustris]ABD05182.1 putative patch repair protein [Rhodopseudomonas palustris HaA2]
MSSTACETPVDPARSALMRRVRQKRTRAEDDVADVLRELGLRFRRNVRTLPGSPDFANKTHHWAIFVNGCFWHRHQGCHRTTTPTRNREFWLAKFAANVKRDKIKTRLLRAMGFRVVTIWECETRTPTKVRRRLKGLMR